MPFLEEKGPLPPLKPRTPEQRAMFRLRRAGAALLALGTATVGITVANRLAELSDANHVDRSELVDTYTVKPNDTPYGLAERFTPPGGNYLPLQDEIVRQAGKDGLQPGEIIHIPDQPKLHNE